MYPIVLVIVTSYLSCVQGQSQCVTQHTTGQCVSLKKCAKLLKLVEQSNRTNAQTILLRESLCGLDKDAFPKVCCEPEVTDNDKEDQRCFTPYGNEGTCSNMSCPILTNILQSPVDIYHRQNMNYIKNHRCNESIENSMCCTTCKPSAGPPHPLTGCCGIDSLNGKPDGKDSATTYINQYPWMASLEYITPKNTTKRFCHGALISSKYVLTCAHCILKPAYNSKGTLINVILGEYDQKNQGPDCDQIEVGGEENCTDGAIRVPIEEFFIHGDHLPWSQEKKNDIALLRLRQTVPFTDFIRPICLPTADVPYDDRSMFFAAGWGATERESKSEVKLKVELPYVNLEVCKEIYYKYAKIEIWEKQLCAGGVAGKDTCKGDSGAPLMYFNGKFYEIAGIVSFGRTQCGILNYPAVHTKVYEYLPWIRSQMKP